MDNHVVSCRQCGQANRIPELGAGKAAVCGKCREPLTTRAPVTVTDSSLASMVAGDVPVVVDFWAPWCGPCRTIAPLIEALARERDDVVFGKLNVDENPMSSSKFKVSGIPTLVFFKNGVERGRLVGAVGRPQIEQAIARNFQ